MKKTEPSFVAEQDRMLQKLSEYAGHSDPDLTRQNLMSVFRVIRTHASFEHSLQFIEILPLPFKMLFLDEWRIQASATQSLRSIDEFAEAVVRSSHNLIATPTEARQLLYKVFTFLGQFSTRTQMQSGLSFLPPEFRALLITDPTLKYQYSDTCIWLS